MPTLSAVVPAGTAGVVNVVCVQAEVAGSEAAC